MFHYKLRCKMAEALCSRVHWLVLLYFQCQDQTPISSIGWEEGEIMQSPSLWVWKENGAFRSKGTGYRERKEREREGLYLDALVDLGFQNLIFGMDSFGPFWLCVLGFGPPILYLGEVLCKWEIGGLDYVCPSLKPHDFLLFLSLFPPILTISGVACTMHKIMAKLI